HLIYHIKGNHCLDHKCVPVAKRRSFVQHVIIWPSLKKTTRIFKNQPIGLLSNNDPRISGVILVGNAVMKCLKHDLLIVFRNFYRQELILRQNAKLYIAYFLIKLRCCQQKWGAEMLISTFCTL